MDILFRYFIIRRRFIIFCFLFFLSFINFLKSNQRQNYIFSTWFKKNENRILTLRNNIFSFITAKKDNELLVEEISKLRQELVHYNYLLKDKSDRDENLYLTEYKFKYIPARVIKNTNKANFNYFIIDRGFEEGIKPNMGVVNRNGIVGIIDRVYDRYSIGLSLYNKNVIIDSKIKSNNSFGSIYWEGNNNRFLSMEGISAHLELKNNDSVFTNGYSFIFPRDILIGVLRKAELRVNTTFYSIEVEPTVDFYNLNSVYIIDNTYYEYLKYIEGE